MDTSSAERPPRRLRTTIVLLIGGIAVSMLLKSLLVEAFFIPSRSMEPTLRVHDRVFVNKLAREPRRGDIVVFWREPGCTSGCPPVRRPSALDKALALIGIDTGVTPRHYIKRVVGLPGETVRIRDGSVLVCDFPGCLPEEDGRAVSFANAHADHDTVEPVVLAADEYYVMGDNRASSADSRVFGAVHREAISGRAFVRWWPVTRWGRL